MTNDSAAWVGGAYGLTAAFLWAMSALIWKGAVTRYGARPANLFKCVAASAVFWLAMVLGLTDWPSSDLASTSILLVSGVLGLTIGDGFLFRSMQLLGAGPAMVLMQLTPLWSALIGAIWFGERLTGWQYAAIPLTCVGIAWVVRGRVDGEAATAHRSNVLRAGLFTGVLAALCNAVGALISKAPLESSGVIGGTALRLTGASLFGLAFAAATGRWRRWTRPIVDAPRLRSEWIAVLCGTVLGVAFMQASLAVAPASVALTLTSTTPVFLLPLALRIGERYRPRAYLGVVLVIAGVVLLLSSQESQS